jgi:hypothetical protein
MARLPRSSSETHTTTTNHKAKWSAAVEQQGVAASQRCAQSRHRPPAIAFCIAGAARSFATPVVQAHLQHNLTGATAGDRALVS